MEIVYEAHIRSGQSASSFDWREPLGWTVENWELVYGVPEIVLLPYSPKLQRKEQRSWYSLVL